MKNYDFIRFTNGYGKNKPAFDIEYDDLFIGPGKIKWGAAEGEIYFVLKLGKILKKYNIE